MWYLDPVNAPLKRRRLSSIRPRVVYAPIEVWTSLKGRDDLGEGAYKLKNFLTQVYCTGLLASL